MVLAATALVVGACNMYTADTAREGIGYREVRFAEISAMRKYRACRDDAMEIDRKAKSETSTARYLASARLLEKCESELGPEASKVAREERMRAVALAIQNYFKGGDIAKSRSLLQKLKKVFPGHDLHLADGSSYLDTMEVLLGVQDRSSIGEFSVANVSGEMKSELRRLRYWQKN